MKTFRKIKNIVKADGPDDDYIVVERYTDLNYTLIYRNSSYQPWVAAWGYHEGKGYWEQGHYFERLEDAMAFIQSKREKVVDPDLVERLIDTVEDFIAGDDSDEVFIYGERRDRLVEMFETALK